MVQKVRDGDVRTVSRLIRDLEDGIPEAKATIRQLYPYTGKAHIIGITGSPGAGKSTIVDAMIEAYRREDKAVGVLAVDPTSPYTGGAILGDRVRMQRHAEDPQVYVRSFATRGALGGLSKVVGDAIHVLDAMGKDVIIVETVGTGQQEVEIINHAHTVTLVLVPGMGDEIQVIKAGIMEIADIFVVNKADREGTKKLTTMLQAMLDMAPEGAKSWRPPVITMESVFDPLPFKEKIAALTRTIEDHYRHLVTQGIMEDRLRRKAEVELHGALHAYLFDPVLREMRETGLYERMVSRVMGKECDPYTAAEEAIGNYRLPKGT